MPKGDLNVLSDDEPILETPEAKRQKLLDGSAKQSPAKVHANPASIRVSLGKLRNAICACVRQAKCNGSMSCFKKFHGGGMEAVFQLRWNLCKLDKQDMDNEAGVLTSGWLGDTLHFDSFSSVGACRQKFKTD